ncbi:hypothetical protein Tsubulata_021853 [Turnera subulata]|uniref:Protein transport protein SEC23 n=1 Tax=Turnera subulata TaxID=218843 RepID=A0A9Q0FZ83_9ROSI|nr:hypothetical protein Tsubulata_021853 [Turnera subulata]
MARFVNRVGSNPQLLSSNAGGSSLFPSRKFQSSYCQPLLSRSSVPSSSSRAPHSRKSFLVRVAGFSATPSDFAEPIRKSSLSGRKQMIPSVNGISVPSRYVIPISAMYTPIKPFSDMPVLPYSPLRCHTLPPELFPQYTTVEYQQDTLPNAFSPPPLTCLCVVDTCLLEQEIGFLRSALSQAMHLIPDTSLVGLITFGIFVQVHELGFPHLPKRPMSSTAVPYTDRTEVGINRYDSLNGAASVGK